MVERLGDLLEGIRKGMGPTDSGGNVLCECGAVLAAGRFICRTCVDANQTREQERRERARVAAYRDFVEGFASHGMKQLPDWSHAYVGADAFAAAVHPKLAKVARNYPLDRTLVLLGSSGTGKTTSVIAALRRVHDQAVAQTVSQGSKPAPLLHDLKWLTWVTANTLAQARRQHPLGEGEAPLVARALRAPVLVIDDLGHEPLSPELWEVVDAAYQRAARLILTSGLRPAQIRERYGDAFWRRLSENNAAVIEVWD